MWTVVYVAQKSQEVSKIKLILDENKIISRVRRGNDLTDEEGTCYEIMVPAAELSDAQDLILEFEMYYYFTVGGILMSEIKRIGILTSGGDAPGMNAAIRAVVRTAIYNGIEVYGVVRGYNGLINGDFINMDARSVGETLQKGGTILQTARCLEFKEPAGVQKAVEVAKENAIDGLVVVGGDGSFRGARDLTRAGLPTVAIPGTIDNDISCSEYTIGYDTCLNTVVSAVDKL